MTVETWGHWGSGRYGQILLATLGLFLLMCCTVALVIYVAARHANQQSVADSLQRVKSHLEERQRNLESQVLIFAYWEAGVDNLTGEVDPDWVDVEMGQFLIDDFGIHLWFVLDPEGRPAFLKKREVILDPSRLDLTDQDRQGILVASRLDIGPPPKPRSSYLLVDGEIFLVSHAALIIESRLVPVEETRVLAFARPLEGQVFRDIRKLYEVSLEISQVRPAAERSLLSLPVESPNGGVLAWISWRVELAGDRLLRRILPWVALAFLATLVIGLFMLRRVSRMHGDLARSEQLFRDAVDALPDGFVIFDAQDRLAVSNTRYREMYRRSAPVLSPGSRFEDIIRYGFEHGQYVATEETEKKLSLEERVARRMAQHRNPGEALEQLTDDGRWLRVVERHMSDGGMVSFRADITELKLREQELLAAKQLAEAANEAKSQFLATVSHEVRTPLNAVLGLLGMLEEEQLGAKAQGYVAVARQSGEHLLGILNNLLDLARLEAGKFVLEPVSCDPKDLLQNVGDMLRPLAAAKDLELVVGFRGTCGRLTADEGRLRQVLLNLGNNAIKFTESGRVSLEGSCRPAGPGRLFMVFSVQDTGVGISPEQVDAIFQPFSQLSTGTNRGFGGVGLGLAISQKLLEAMDSSLSVSSEPGVGSRFFFQVEVDKAEDLSESAGTAAVRAVPEGSARVGNGAPAARRILAADDAPTNLVVLQAMLRGSGYEVDVVENGKQVLAAMAARRYDLVLMDVAMPELDGIEATRKIRQHPGMADIPIIALTASAMKGDRERFLEAGMNDYLAKPLRREALLELLERWLRQPDQ